jgi:hypothetical protein
MPFPSPKWEGKRSIYSWYVEGENCARVVYPSMPKTAKVEILGGEGVIGSSDYISGRMTNA